jgi:hypothetical protein
MSDPAPLAYGRDAADRFTRGNTEGHGRAHASAQQAAALRRAFYAEVKPADMRAVVRKLVSQALEGHLQAAHLVLLWIVGKPAVRITPPPSRRCWRRRPRRPPHPRRCRPIARPASASPSGNWPGRSVPAGA